MIFSKFLKKKWQHKNSVVRIEAINNSLSVEDEEQRDIIAELAKADDNENVRRAALIKLNSYSTWLAHSQENSMVKIKQYAHKKVETILTDQDDITVTEQEKFDYIANHNDYKFFEQWLKIAEQTSLIITLFEKLNSKSLTKGASTESTIKPQLLVNLFNQKQNSEVQQYILEKVHDVETLDKLKKKALNTEITNQIETKITALQFAIEQPLILSKKVNLVLSKLQALKEQSDYRIYIEKRDALNAEWQCLNEDFHCLDSEIQEEFIDKKESISTNLTKIFAVKAEQFAQAEIARKIDEEKQQCRIHFDKTLNIVEKTLTTSIFENDEIDEQQYQSVFDKLTNEIIASPLTKDEQNDFIAKISQQHQKLQQLPEIAKLVSEATHLISKISQLTLPSNIEEMNERLPIFDEWKASWKIVEKQSAGILPDSIISASKEVQLNWREALKPLQQKQKQEFSATQKKINDVKRLVAGGKYNAAFGVFKKVKQLFSALSDHQQQRLQREFDTVNEKITELADWEHYIATPRKQQLLTEIKTIVETPLDNPNEQAEKVKQYRKTWNSLGHADDDAEKELNYQFNQLCESAFAPCRLFFAEQEKIREQHLVARQSYVEQAKKLSEYLATISKTASEDGVEPTETAQDNSAIDFKMLDNELNSLMKQWKNAGQVDRSVYQDINKQFNDALHPVKSAINNFHYQNKALKSALIKEAEKASLDENIYNAISQVKGLQSKWRDIGYSGAKFENKLWQTFRKINDDIFAKRDQQLSLEKAASSEKLAEFELVFKGIETQFTDFESASNVASEQLTTLQRLEQELAVLKQQLSQQQPKMVALEKQIANKEKAISNKIVKLKANKEKEQWLTLFTVLEESLSVDTHESNDNDNSFNAHKQFNQLSPAWQKKLQELGAKNNVVSRDNSTLELEILSGVPSPEELQQQRMQVQVGLMQEQMLSGNEIDLPAKFIQWLMLGKLTQQDIGLLQRIKVIFV